ncbi:adhesin [Moraxella sp. ZJ142]|uniref:ACP-like domain-containing protein n=1 Tax=Moraxella marmotae TaxID=3344520 RepID=UPI0035D4B662
MKKIIPAIVLALTSTAVFANSAPQSDAQQAYQNTVKTRTVNYSCQNDNQVEVTYGFDKHSKPTYAEAKIDGKNRFMPVNLKHSDVVSSAFGDEDNFSLMANVLTPRNVRKSSINIQDPASQIIFKGCEATKAHKAK